MNLYFHGGKCCGIKTIEGFPHYPYSQHSWGEKHIAYPLPEVGAVRNHDVYGQPTTKPFFTDAAPEESIQERFARLIAFCKRRRPQGCIEVTLARNQFGSFNQVALWEPLLLEHGFKVTVPEFKNSNSQNYVTIYHLVYDAKAEKKASAAASAATTPDPFGRT